jgi:hypothetical protein
MISELFWQCNILRHDFGTVLTVWYFSTWLRYCSESVVFFDMISELSEQFRNHVGNTTLSELFGNHVGNTTLSKQFRNHAEKYQTVRTVPKSCRKIPHSQNSSEIMSKNITDSVVFPTWFLNCSDSVVFPTWFLNCSDSVVFPTSFLNYSGSVVEQFRNHVCKHVEFRNHVAKYHTARIVQKWCRKYYTVRTV